MNSQEMFPQSQDEGSEIQAQPYYKVVPPKNGKTGEMPKNEHPANFDSIPPYGYVAQDTQAKAYYAPQEGSPAMEQQASGRQRRQQRQRFSPDGDAFEYGYRPYQNYNAMTQAPWWARPQQNRMHPLRWIILIALACIFIKPLLIVFGLLLGGLGIVFGAVLLVTLLPILIIFAILAGFFIFALVVMALFGVPIRPGKMWGQWRGYRRNRR